MPLLWEEGIAGYFPVDIIVDALSQRGSLGRITSLISASDANILTVRAQEEVYRHSTIELTLAVRNRAHLARIMRKLHRCADVAHVTRVKPH